ncbi:F-box domain-containing protein [Dioscorea alata]|uniref:F-box domain-containing protein n=1 Tax=Dioscorea alata TaxID=55571 RepID=A0ACB7TZX9_DIOAL|nr:F-box domain-containing protein [Dioscorea alata]
MQLNPKHKMKPPSAKKPKMKPPTAKKPKMKPPSAKKRKKTPPNPKRRDWSGLTKLILFKISGHLNAVDHIRFRSICTSWRAASAKRPMIPLIIDCEVDLENHLLSLSFYDLVLKQNIPFPSTAFTTIAPLIADKRLYFIGSSFGWIHFFSIEENLKAKISILNPFTSEFFSLPELNHTYIITPTLGLRVVVFLPIVICFTAVPAHVNFIRIGANQWKTIILDNGELSCVTQFKDRFYCHYKTCSDDRTRNTLHMIDLEANEGNGAVVPVELYTQYNFSKAGQYYRFLSKSSEDLIVCCYSQKQLAFQFFKVDFENGTLKQWSVPEPLIFSARRSQPLLLPSQEKFRGDRFYFIEFPNALTIYDRLQFVRLLRLNGYLEYIGRARMAAAWFTPVLLNKSLM